MTARESPSGRADTVVARLSSDAWVQGLYIPVLLRLAMMALQLLVVNAMLGAGQGSAFSRLSIWDGQLYAHIVTSGYPHSITVDATGQLRSGSQFAFFPVYPALARLLTQVTALDAVNAGLVVSFVASCALGPLVRRATIEAGGSSRAGRLAVVLIGLLPMSIVFEMAYAEAVFTALGVAAWICAQRGRWGWAGLLLALAGLTRPVGYVVTAGVLVMGVQAWRRHHGSRAQLRPVLLAAAAGFAAAPAFWAFTAVRTGRLTGWFYVQRVGWHTTFDLGSSTRTFLTDNVFHASASSEAAIPCATVLLGYLVLTSVCASVRDAPYATIAAIGWLTVVLSSNYWHSKPRLLLAGALAVVPVAVWLSRQSPRITLALLGFAGVVSFWFSSYMITQWPYAI